MKVISEEVAVLEPFDLWIFLRGMRKNSLFSEGGKKKWALSGGRENCVGTFGIFLLGGKSKPTSSIGGGGGGAIKWNGPNLGSHQIH